jgi:hypothetical protein
MEKSSKYISFSGKLNLSHKTNEIYTY